MKIKRMFKKPIDRKINGTIKVEQTRENIVAQELSDYIVTNELIDHFKVFFENYNESLYQDTDGMGVWISGFYGSGKSHFLKILSYLLANQEVQGKKPIDYFKEDNKISDESIMSNIENVANNSNTDVILFNIDSEDLSYENQKDKILDVFLEVFNQHLGYFSELPFIAEIERKLDTKGKYQDFKDEFERIYGSSWIDSRNDLFPIKEYVEEAAVNIDHIKEKDKEEWLDKEEKRYRMSVKKLANIINEYCESKGSDYRLIFLIDEVGQFIGSSKDLMLKLQTVVEDIGITCEGKVWVIVTSQEMIDETPEFDTDEFSKIQARFNTRLSLTSANVDEVINKRILEKNDKAIERLKGKYQEKESIIKNIITFKDCAEMKVYKNGDDYALTYPFIPYQFNLLQSILTEIRKHKSSEKHLPDGERSMLELYHYCAKNVMNQDDDILIGLNSFYEPIKSSIHHSYRKIIDDAGENNHLNKFDVEVLKVLFLIKDIKEIEPYKENISSLMVSNINENKIDLKKQVSSSLENLEKETLIQKKGERYFFLNDEEQKVNNDIKNEVVEDVDVLNRVGDIIYDEIIKVSRCTFKNRYEFDFNRYIDGRLHKREKGVIGVNIISPYYYTDISNNQLTLDGYPEDVEIINILKLLSDQRNDLVINLNDQDEVFKEIYQSLKIEKYLLKHDDLKKNIQESKQDELSEKNERIKRFLENALMYADIYIQGDLSNISGTQPKDRIIKAFNEMILQVFSKLNHIENTPDKNDIKEALDTIYLDDYLDSQPDSFLALDDLIRYIDDTSEEYGTLSLKDVINHFKGEPFGFMVVDIEWLIANLFSQREISIFNGSEELSLKEDGSDQIFSFITEPKYRDQIVISKKKKMSEEKIKSAKNVLSEAFEKSYSPGKFNDENLMDKIKDEMETRLDEINQSLKNYTATSEYKDDDVLEEAKSLYEESIKIKNMSQFYDNIFKHENEIIKNSEDLEQVLHFFDKQKKIFDESVEIVKKYNNNKKNIDDKNLDNLVSDINKIIDAQSYNEIYKLKDLNKEFDVRYDEILEDVKKHYEDVLDHWLNETIDFIKQKNNDENRIKDVKNDFDDLDDELNDSESIRDLRLIEVDAKDIYEKVVNDFEQLEKENQLKESETEQTITKPKITVKNINIEQLDLPSSVTLKDISEIDDFTELLNSILKNESGENVQLNLQLK